MHFVIPNRRPAPAVILQRGAKRFVLLILLPIYCGSV